MGRAPATKEFTVEAAVGRGAEIMDDDVPEGTLRGGEALEEVAVEGHQETGLMWGPGALRERQIDV